MAKPKMAIKIVIDVLMSIGLLFMMGYHLWGEDLHEYVGAGMLVLFILHHILNRNWYKNLFKGKYTPMRIFTLIVDILALAAMLALMYSGIAMSRYVFDFLPLDASMMLARRLHILGSYWGFILMGLHLGLHWIMFVNMAKKQAGITKPSKVRAAAAFVVSLGIAAYGAMVFVQRDFMTYMLLKSEFVFLDYEESKILFYLDYIALIGLFVFLAHYISKLLKALGKKNAKQ